MTGSYQDMALAISQVAPQSMRLQPPSFADRVFISTMAGALVVGVAHVFRAVLREDFSCRLNLF
jgi:hypothetical protein